MKQTKQNRFSIVRQMKSFKYAFNGLKLLVKEEHNLKIHFVLASLAIVMGIFFRISAMEWIGIVLSIGLVITIEVINSSIENIADFISPERNEIIKRIKDISAAAVLISTIAALTVGLIIFLPKI